MGVRVLMFYHVLLTLITTTTGLVFKRNENNTTRNIFAATLIQEQRKRDNDELGVIETGDVPLKKKEDQADMLRRSPITDSQLFRTSQKNSRSRIRGNKAKELLSDETLSVPSNAPTAASTTSTSTRKSSNNVPVLSDAPTSASPISTSTRKANNKSSKERNMPDQIENPAAGITKECKLKEEESAFLVTFTADTSSLTDEELIDAFRLAYDHMVALINGCTSEIQSIVLEGRERDGAEYSLEFYVTSKQVKDTSLVALPEETPLFLWGFNAALNDKEVEAVSIRIPGSPTASPSNPLLSALGLLKPVTQVPANTPSSSQLESINGVAGPSDACNFARVQSSYLVSFNQDASVLKEKDLIVAFKLGYDSMTALIMDCAPTIESKV